MNTRVHSGQPATSIKVVAAKLSDVGQSRDHNEDYVIIAIPSDPALLRSKGALYVVADGMGGYLAGEVASETAAETVAQAYYEDTNFDVASSLSRAVQKANLAVYTAAQDNPQCQGMGTTTVAAVVRGSEVHIVNVGDSRAYLVRNGLLSQVTRDHSLVQEQIDAGIVSPENARNLPHRNVITRAMGHKAEIKVDSFQGELLPGDTLLLCSDGLSGPVEDHDIEAILQQYPPGEAVSSLVQLANQQGGPDNISALVVRAAEKPTEHFTAVEVPPRIPSAPPQLASDAPPAERLPRVTASLSLPPDHRRIWLGAGLIAVALVLVTLGVILWSGKTRNPGDITPTVPSTTQQTGEAQPLTSTPAASAAGSATPGIALKPTSTAAPATATFTPRPTPEETAVPGCTPLPPRLLEPADMASKYAGQRDVVFTWEGGQVCRDDQVWQVTFDSPEANCSPAQGYQATCALPSSEGQYQWWLQLWSGGEIVLNVRSTSHTIIVNPPPEGPGPGPSVTPQGTTCQSGPKPDSNCEGTWQWDTESCSWRCER